MSNRRATSLKSILKIQEVAPNTDRSTAGDVSLKFEKEFPEAVWTQR